MTKSANLFAVLEPIAHPAKVLMETLDGRTITELEAFNLSGRMANTLRACKVQPGDRVAVQVEKSLEALILYLACLRAGAVYLPLNIAYTLAELDYFIADAEPRLIICDPERKVGVVGISRRAVVATLDSTAGGSFMEMVATQPIGFETVALGGDDLAAILYTSGTTGRSKGAMLTHDNLTSNARVLVNAWRFTADDVLIHALPIYHTHGLFVATNTALFARSSILFLPKFDAGEVLRLMPRATTLMGVPTFYTRLLAHEGLTREAAANMRLFVSGSAPLLEETHRKFREITGHAVLERYGMTETGMNTSNPYDGDRVPGSVGFPLPGVSLRIADSETGTPKAVGEIGVIEVKGPNVFKGYWRIPEKTASEFRPDGFFITGDLATVDDRGYVRIVGRAKDLIITGGLNVYPKEIESEIDSISGVIESAVVGVPHADFGEAILAVVVATPRTISEKAILDALKDRLAKFKLPKRVMIVDELPRNAMGKVQKAVLRERYGTIFN